MKTVKFITIITLIVVAACTLSACKKEVKTPTVVEILTTMRGEIEFPEMAEIDKENLALYYEIDKENIDSMSYIVAGSGITTDEVLLVKMKDGTDMDKVKAQMETRKKTQTDLFSSYNPDEMPKLKSSVIEVNGNYAMFAITNDNKKAKEIFTKAF